MYLIYGSVLIPNNTLHFASCETTKKLTLCSTGAIDEEEDRSVSSKMNLFKNPSTGEDDLGAPKHKGSCSKQEDSHHDHDREKVLEILRAFREACEKYDREKQARRDGDSPDATSRIHIKAHVSLEREGIYVRDNITGPVPGIYIGDEFQYKVQLRLVGLHLRPMCGIDYVEDVMRSETTYATCIVSSEGYGYNDKFEGDVLIYTGEGGNVTGKDEKRAEDQKMIKGNLALFNNIKFKTPVRVIRGMETCEGKGKRWYVYVGLYSVDKYWLEKGVSGKSVFKFQLSKIRG